MMAPWFFVVLLVPFLHPCRGVVLSGPCPFDLNHTDSEFKSEESELLTIVPFSSEIKHKTNLFVDLQEDYNNDCFYAQLPPKQMTIRSKGTSVYEIEGAIERHPTNNNSLLFNSSIQFKNYKMRLCDNQRELEEEIRIWQYKGITIMWSCVEIEDHTHDEAIVIFYSTEMVDTDYIASVKKTVQIFLKLPMIDAIQWPTEKHSCVFGMTPKFSYPCFATPKRLWYYIAVGSFAIVFLIIFIRQLLPRRSNAVAPVAWGESGSQVSNK